MSYKGAIGLTNLRNACGTPSMKLLCSQFGKFHIDAVEFQYKTWRQDSSRK